MVELYKPTGNFKLLNSKQKGSSFPILTSPKKLQFFTSSELNESDTNK